MNCHDLSEMLMAQMQGFNSCNKACQDVTSVWVRGKCTGNEDTGKMPEGHRHEMTCCDKRPVASVIHSSERALCLSRRQLTAEAAEQWLQKCASQWNCWQQATVGSVPDSQALNNPLSSLLCPQQVLLDKCRVGDGLAIFVELVSAIMEAVQDKQLVLAAILVPAQDTAEAECCNMRRSISPTTRAQ